MNKAIQYSTDLGVTWETQLQFTADDISDVLCWNCTKDVKGNLYVLGSRSTYGEPSKLFKITRNGLKKRLILLPTTNMGDIDNVDGIQLSPDGLGVFFGVGYGYNYRIGYCSIAEIEAEVPVSYKHIITGGGGIHCLLSAYQNLYMWYANTSDKNIYIFTYTLNPLIFPLDIYTNTENSLALYLTSDNILYTISPNYLTVCTFDGLNITGNEITCTGAFTDAKEMKLDKDGCLIILINTGTESYIKKYTTEGTQVGSTLDLDGVYHNLNTDTEGNIYYSNATSTMKSDYNAIGLTIATIIREEGMTTYGNNITGYRR